MNIKSITKYAKISPKKAKLLANSLINRPALETFAKLDLLCLKSARIIKYTLKSAIYNGENNFKITPDKLYIKSVVINKGPVLRRYRPVARGSAHIIRKKTSHISITLSLKN